MVVCMFKTYQQTVQGCVVNSLNMCFLTNIILDNIIYTSIILTLETCDLLLSVLDDQVTNIVLGSLLKFMNRFIHSSM